MQHCVWNSALTLDDVGGETNTDDMEVSPLGPLLPYHEADEDLLLNVMITRQVNVVCCSGTASTRERERERREHTYRDTHTHTHTDTHVRSSNSRPPSSDCGCGCGFVYVLFSLCMQLLHSATTAVVCCAAVVQSGNLGFKLTPAYLLQMCIAYRSLRDGSPALRRLLTKISTHISTVVEVRA